MFNLGEFSMKKTLVALAALAATASFAQSSVTISGIMDLGVVYNSNVQAGAAKLSVGAANNNRIIFSGVEDLGGGMAATFAAQMRFSATTGTAEGSAAGVPGAGSRPLFQGETRVGLRGGFGAIRLGRGLTALQAPNGGYIDPWGVSTVAGSLYAPGFATDYNAGGEGRTDGIFYDSPKMGPLQLSVTYSPRKIGNAAAATAFGKTLTSIALTYNDGPIQFLIGQENNRHGDTLLNIGGNFNMGVAKIYAGYGLTKGGNAAERANSAATAFAAAAAQYPGASTGSATAGQVKANAKIAAWSVGAAIPMGASTIRVGYSNINPDAIQFATDRSDTKLGVGLEYALSKRTALYTNFASQTRKNNVVTGNKATDNSRITAMDFGMTHRF